MSGSISKQDLFLLSLLLTHHSTKPTIIFRLLIWLDNNPSRLPFLLTFWSPNLICLREFLETFILQRKILFSPLREAEEEPSEEAPWPRISSAWMAL